MLFHHENKSRLCNTVIMPEEEWTVFCQNQEARAKRSLLTVTVGVRVLRGGSLCHRPGCSGTGRVSGLVGVLWCRGIGVAHCMLQRGASDQNQCQAAQRKGRSRHATPIWRGMKCFSHVPFPLGPLMKQVSSLYITDIRHSPASWQWQPSAECLDCQARPCHL